MGGCRGCGHAPGKAHGFSIHRRHRLMNIVIPIIDGGTTYVGVENDFSGSCSNDAGAIEFPAFLGSIVCAHFVASSRDGSGPKMRFAYLNPLLPGCYDVW